MLAYFVDNFDPFIFRLWDNVGPRWYGFAYILAFISAYFIVRLLSKRGYCDLPPDRVSDFITWTALFGVLLGGRIGYVLFYNRKCCVSHCRSYGCGKAAWPVTVA